MTTPETDPATALRATAIITLRFRKPGKRRRAAAGTVAVVGTDGADPEADSTSVSLELLRAPEFAEITSYDNAARGLLREQALPATLAPGSWLVPLALVERIYGALDDYAVRRRGLVETFLTAYPRIVDDARARLRDAFDERMFPPVDTVRGAFSMDYALEVADREAGVRAAGTSLSQAFVARELARARETGAGLLAEIRDGLRVAFADLVDAAAEALAPAEDGRKRPFSGSHVEKIQAFLETFATKNVAGDGALADVVARARAVLSGVTPETVRDAKDRPARDRLAQALVGVRADLEASAVVAPRRRIVLEDEPAGAVA